VSEYPVNIEYDPSGQLGFKWYATSDFGWVHLYAFGLTERAAKRKIERKIRRHDRLVSKVAKEKRNYEYAYAVPGEK
jgi:hypothetical protein